jgi:hypothetical protein
MFEFYSIKATDEKTGRFELISGVVKATANKVGKIFQQHPEIVKYKNVKIRFFEVGE